MKKHKIKTICKALKISRSNQYQNLRPRPARYKREGDEAVLSEIRCVTRERSTYGYPRVTGILRMKHGQDGRPLVNEKRIYRLMAMGGLLLKRPIPRPQRPHDGKVITLRSDMRYCSDIFEFKCDDGQEIHVAFSLDCHDREAISFVAKPHDLDHQDTMQLMDQTTTNRFGPSVEKLPHAIQWLSDNGGQYTADAVKAYGEAWGYDMRTTPAYSPESNGVSEAFVKTFKRDYVYAHALPDAVTVLGQLSKWFEDYNKNAPHSGLKYLSPWEYRARQKKNESHNCPTNNANDSGRPQLLGYLKEKMDNRKDLGLLKTG